MVTMANVNYKHPDVIKFSPQWDLVRHCLEGQRAIKRAKEVYLPIPNVTDTSDINQKRYLQYLERALFYNVTSRTQQGLTGQVFQSKPEVVVPPELEVLLEDVDGTGVTLNQAAKRALEYVLAYGRCGILVDYPEMQAPSSIEEMRQGFVRPIIALYQPWQIINWRTTLIGAKKTLSLVVIEETYTSEEDDFSCDTRKQWRVLNLEKDTGTYRVDIWREEEGSFTLISTSYPKDSNGATFPFIPFSFIGSSDNNISVDQAPLYDLAVINIAHYRNSADYEEASFIMGQPTPYIAGLTKDWVTDVLKGGIQLGSRAAIPLPAGGTAGLLQMSPNTMPKEAMDNKERQMVALGAKLIEQVATQRTATEVNQDSSSEVSVLGGCSSNVSDAFTKALSWCALFSGGSEEVVYRLDTDFLTNNITAQDRAQMVVEWNAGLLTFDEMRTMLVRADVATIPSEEARKIIALEKPTEQPTPTKEV